MEMVERVARAICTVRGGEPCACLTPDPDVCFMDLALARAAIAAMREPTDAMVAAGLDGADGCTDGWTVRAACIAEHVWGDMIDAALPAQSMAEIS